MLTKIWSAHRLSNHRNRRALVPGQHYLSFRRASGGPRMSAFIIEVEDDPENENCVYATIAVPDLAHNVLYLIQLGNDARKLSAISFYDGIGAVVMDAPKRQEVPAVLHRVPSQDASTRRARGVSRGFREEPAPLVKPLFKTTIDEEGNVHLTEISPWEFQRKANLPRSHTVGNLRDYGTSADLNRPSRIRSFRDVVDPK